MHRSPLAIDGSEASPAELSYSFEGFYRLEYPALVAVARALIGTHHDAEDVVHDTMVRAFLHWGKVSRFDRPGGWCHRVLLNVCRNWWRRARREARFRSLTERLRPGSTPELSPDIVAFWQAVRTLPDRPRTAVALYYAADRSVGEVASILGVPEGTVRSDLTRARRALHSELESP